MLVPTQSDTENGDPSVRLDADAHAGLEALAALATQECLARGAMIWLVDGVQPRALVHVGIADTEVADQLALAVQVVNDGVEPAASAESLIGTPLLRADGRTLGGLCLVGARAGAGASLPAFARQAAILLELGRKLDEHRRGEQAAQATAAQLGDVIANLPIVVFVVDREGLFTLSDGGALHRIGLSAGQVVGMSVFDLYAGNPMIVENLRECLRGVPGVWTAEVGDAVYETRATPLFDADGQPAGLIGVALDITDRVRLEAEHKRLQDAVITAQAATLAELSTPLIPISRDTLVLPLIGAIDAARAERVRATLLEGITAARARVAIVDITGVVGMDAQTAGYLLGAARAVRLLGAQVVLTGIRAEVAQTLVELDVDLRAVIIRATLESGVAWAMNRH